ncbi:hypothetical protein ANN_24520 [Periplaneta americana]|uniref:Regulatory protein zeste n=1 Tax=Periplaneta americana TaxID=6978 RepID=A0ABQ8S3G5_PERAM|nr:hypothetical protein ANN_24520 [Periplaneta americana]
MPDVSIATSSSIPRMSAINPVSILPGEWALTVSTVINNSDRKINLRRNSTEVSVIENKKTDGTALKQKEAAWEKLCNDFNFFPNVAKRNVKQLQLFYDNFKRKCKKNLVDGKVEHMRTGGGPMNITNVMDDSSIKLLSLLKEQINPLHNAKDSDAFYQDGSSRGERFVFSKSGQVTYSRDFALKNKDVGENHPFEELAIFALRVSSLSMMVEDEIERITEALTQMTADKRVILAGNLNARIEKPSTKTELILETLKGGGYSLINKPDLKTYIALNGTSTIDLVLFRGESINAINQKALWISAITLIRKHVPVTTTFKFSQPLLPTRLTLNRISRKLDTEKLKESLGKIGKATHLIQQHQVMEVVELCTVTLQSCQIKIKDRKSQPWFDKECHNEEDAVNTTLSQNYNATTRSVTIHPTEKDIQNINKEEGGPHRRRCQTTSRIRPKRPIHSAQDHLQ